jgi:hypothetical protein
LGLWARLAGENGAKRCASSLRSPSTLFLGDGEEAAATALDAAEMVGDMKFFGPEARAGVGVVLAAAAASRCWSFSFSPKDLRRGEAWQPQTAPPLEKEAVVLCGQSADRRGVKSSTNQNLQRKRGRKSAAQPKSSGRGK